MCNKANDPPLIVSRAPNPQVHPRNLSPIHHHQLQRLSDLSKATQLMSRARDTSLLTGNLRLCYARLLFGARFSSMRDPQVTCIKHLLGWGRFLSLPYHLLEMLILGPKPDLLNPIYWEWGPDIGILIQLSCPSETEAQCSREWNGTSSPLLPTLTHKTESN